MNVTPPEYEVIDGFSLNQALRCNLTFQNLAVHETFDRLRRTGAYRSKFWCMPRDSQQIIPARNSFEIQERCVPGSAIWGFLFVVANSDVNPGPFSLQIRESCTGVSLFSEVVRADRYAASVQQMFSRLLVVPTPGLINIEIASQQATDATGVQLILCGGEPVCL